MITKQNIGFLPGSWIALKKNRLPMRSIFCAHPRPLLDLVRLVPFMRGGGWIMLHDIQLGSDSLAKGNQESLPFGAPFGAESLFNGWPFRKISGGNIGAVQIPADKTAIIALALRLMRIPFEVGPGIEVRRVRRALHQSLAELW